MQKPDQILDAIRRQAFLPLFFHPDEAASIAIAQTLYDSGVRLIEYTNRGETALANFSALKKAAATQMPELILSAGTIKTPQQARQFIEAGADFIIAPVVNPEVANVVQQSGRLWIPGCMTPTEIHQAEENGARLVKIFPGNILGPGFVSSVKELFPNMLFMPTGGVDLTAESMTAWFGAGVIAVGLGSKLIDKEILQNHDMETLRGRCATAIKLAQSVNNPVL
ncbi:MAG: bifunctional 4-hydroxy-2-oxoglutarate aldolase/2-dehydro-3-deoxy-phosphogluconate aldolase [Mucilaginibacter polytrichastri]|nr:bifunctional 4-hydroxy-2-oxoglutarate aldolase/2-dehydro-3-deoxy-phosphogluconate aldolase [Mucilaginibacter polytrichastri]